MKPHGDNAVKAWWPLPLRLIVGFGFVAHGMAKLSRGVGVFAVTLTALGVPKPQAMAWMTVVVEIVGGLAVLAGAAIRVISAPLAIVLLAAVFTVHLDFGFSSIKLLGVTDGVPRFGPPGYEVDLLYLASLAALIIGGAGPLSVDRMIALRRRVVEERRRRSTAHDPGSAHH